MRFQKDERVRYRKETTKREKVDFFVDITLRSSPYSGAFVISLDTNFEELKGEKLTDVQKMQKADKSLIGLLCGSTRTRTWI